MKLRLLDDEKNYRSISSLSSVLVTRTDLQLRELEVQRQIQEEKLRFKQEPVGIWCQNDVVLTSMRCMTSHRRINTTSFLRLAHWEERMQKEQLEREGRKTKKRKKEKL